MRGQPNKLNHFNSTSEFHKNSKSFPLVSAPPQKPEELTLSKVGTKNRNWKMGINDPKTFQFTKFYLKYGFFKKLLPTRGNNFEKKQCFCHRYSWNSEIETTWRSLIGWPLRTSSWHRLEFFFTTSNLYAIRQDT